MAGFWQIFMTAVAWNTVYQPVSLDADEKDKKCFVEMLPPELMTLIQQHLLGESKQRLVHTLLLSKVWYSTGILLLYKDVVLSSDSIAPFVRTIAESHELPRHVRSLTIHTDVETSSSDTLNLGLNEAARVLSLLSNLESFSIICRPDRNVDSQVPTKTVLDQAVLSSVLLNLPASTTSLELDTKILETEPDNKHHLCPTVQSLLPRLRHLRIRRNLLCHELLQGLEIPCPNLKSVVINDCGRNYRMSCTHISASKFRTDLVAEEIALLARKHYQEGLFPQLKTFVVLTTSHDRRKYWYGDAHEDGLYCKSIVRKDVVRNHTITYALQEVGIQGYYLLHNPRKHIYSDDLLTKSPEGVDANLGLTTLSAGSQVIELDDAWLETTHGSRHPAAHFMSSKYSSDNYTWKPTTELTMLADRVPCAGRSRCLSRHLQKSIVADLRPIVTEGLHRPVAALAKDI